MQFDCRFGLLSPDAIRSWNFQDKKVSRNHFFCPVKWSHASRPICCVFILILIYFTLLCFTLYLLYICVALLYFTLSFLTFLAVFYCLLAICLQPLQPNCFNPQISFKQVQKQSLTTNNFNAKEPNSSSKSHSTGAQNVCIVTIARRKRNGSG